MQDEYRVRARVAEDGKITLENLPGSLKGNLHHYDEPMEPVAEHEWDVLE